MCFKFLWPRYEDSDTEDNDDNADNDNDNDNFAKEKTVITDYKDIDIDRVFLAGKWRLHSVDNIEAYDDAVASDDVLLPMSQTMKPGNVLMTICRLDESNKNWTICYDTPFGISESSFTIGEKTSEVTPDRRRVLSEYFLPYVNKLVVRHRFKNGRISVITREVDTSDTDTLIFTLTAKSVTSTAIFKRVIESADTAVAATSAVPSAGCDKYAEGVRNTETSLI